MHSFSIPVAGEQLHCMQFGHGSRLLLAFHGYGNTAKLFEPLAMATAEIFTTVSIDLPHHGASTWTSTTAMGLKDLYGLVEQLCEKYAVSRFSVVGFSMGGRLTLCLLEKMAAKIDRVLLIAADGLVPNPLYRFVTQTTVGKRCFAYATSGGTAMVWPLRMIARLRILDPSRMKFVEYYLGNESQKQQLRLRWPAVRHLVPDIKKVKTQIATYKVQVHLVFGKHDRIIPAKNGQPLAKHLEAWVHLHLLDTGHQLVTENFIAFYHRLLTTD